MGSSWVRSQSVQVNVSNCLPLPSYNEIGFSVPTEMSWLLFGPIVSLLSTKEPMSKEYIISAGVGKCNWENLGCTSCFSEDFLWSIANLTTSPMRTSQTMGSQKQSRKVFYTHALQATKILKIFFFWEIASLNSKDNGCMNNR